MSYDPVETQIREARERSDVFASSLNKAREQEMQFEKERQKWVTSFEEKSIMIEQLERELTSTVDALNQVTQEKTVVQKELVRSSWDVTNLSQSLESVNFKRVASGPDNSNNSRQDEAAEAGASSRRVLELLQRSQDETTQARRELSNARLERDRLSDQISSMKRQIDRLTEDREEVAKLMKNNDSKLHFRNEQVVDCNAKFLMYSILFHFLSLYLTSVMHCKKIRLVNMNSRRKGTAGGKSS